MCKYPVEEKYGIKVKEIIVSGNPDWDSWHTVHDKELAKQGLGYKAIATQLKREGYKTSFMTVKRILART